MNLEKALHQIAEIHGHLDRSEVYRGYRSLPLGISGLVALGAACLQATLLVPESELAFVRYWVLIAALCGAMSSSEIIYNYLFRADGLFRKKTRRVTGQFLPCLAGGAALTVCLCRSGAGAMALIPGLWSVLFSMGIFASRPYLPRAIGWVGLYYLAAGNILLLLSAGGASLTPWGMGVTFGTGQLLTAMVLYWNIERKEHA